jgi:5-methylcytosine-specific restriction endonuclease McrA
MKGTKNSNYKDAVGLYKCTYCGKEVNDYKNYAKNKKYHYCNRECKGKHHSIIMKGKLAGSNNPMFGKKGKLSPRYKGNYKYCDVCGEKLDKINKTGKCIKHIDRKGKNNSNYIDGRTDLRDKIKTLDEYYNWRDFIYKRDKYTCQECGDNRGGNLEAHHINPFSLIVSEFLTIYSQFSPIENKETLVRLAISYEPLWDISNGKTLCKRCHYNLKKETFKKIKTQIIYHKGMD